MTHGIRSGSTPRRRRAAGRPSIAERAILFGVALALPAAALPGGAQAQGQEDAASTRTTMWEIFDALAAAFELSLSPSQYDSPANRDLILQALRHLAAYADSLESHGTDLHSSYAYLRRSLGRDAGAALVRFEDGQYAGSRFMLQKLTENCFACHSKLPTAHDYDLGARLLSAESAQRLEAEELARLQVATRQFQAALDSYESLMRSAARSPAELDYMGVLRDYLVITLRVERDVGRPAAALDEFGRREDVPDYLSAQLADWTEALHEIDLEVAPDSRLAQARGLIARGRAVNRYPMDRRGLVYFIAASSLLERDLLSGVPAPDELAETYLLLGIAESHIAHSYWVSESEFFLEQAIRSAPGSAAATAAYEVLEAQVTQGYSGSGGVDLPPDVEANLRALRALIDTHR